MSSTVTTPATTRPAPAPWTTELVAAGAALVAALVAWAALVAALVAWAALVPLGGSQLSVMMNGAVTQVTPLNIGVTAFTVGLVGLLVLRVLERFTRKAVTIWTWLAVGVLLLSYAGALTALSTSATLGLIALHSVVGAVVIAVGRRSRR